MASRLQWGAAVVFLGGVVATAAVLLPIPGVMTGFLTLQQEATVSVDATVNGSVSRFDFDRVITIGNSTYFDVEITNDGSVRIAPVNFTVEVYDANGTLQAAYPGPRTGLGPGEFFSRTIKHTPHETGSYTVRLTARIGGDLVRTSEFLFVVAEPQPNTDPIIITRRRLQYEYVYPDPEPEPEPEPEPPTRRSWRVDAPQTVVVQQGGGTTVPLRLTNTGNTPVRNVRLTVRAEENLSLTYNPKLLFEIVPNATRVFAVDVTAPRVTGLRETGFSYQLRSDHLEQRGSVGVDISPTLTVAQLEDQIENLALLLEDLSAEIRVEERRGVNVSTAIERREQARAAVAAARDALDERDFAATRAEIDVAQTDINRAFQSLFHARTTQVTVEAPLVEPVYVLLLLSILVAVVMVGAYHYLQERSQRRPKLLRDMEER